jgi:hypothetical protein
MAAKRKELPVIGQQQVAHPVVQKSKPHGVEKGPFTLEEIDEIREHPVASYLDVVRMLASYDEATAKIFFLVEQIEEVRMLSAKHYQHHLDAMEMYQNLNKEIADVNQTFKKFLSSLEEAAVDKG